MSSEFTAAKNDIVVSDWLENDEGATPHSMLFVVPCACRLKTIHISPSATMTSETWLVQNGALPVGLPAGLSTSADGSLTIQPEPSWSTFSRENTFYEGGDLCEIAPPTNSTDYHITLVFERTA